MNRLRHWLLVVMVVVSAGVAGCTKENLQTHLLTLPESADEPVILHVSPPGSDQPIDWSTCFAVYVDETDNLSSVSPVQGTYQVEKNKLTFRPDFPFAPGVRYRVEVPAEFADGLQGMRVQRLGHEFIGSPFSIPASVKLAQPGVERIFPTADELPENVLRFYIYFSNPMERGWASRAITLRTTDGSEVKNVFMEFKQELWDSDQKRLTVLLDPGRIKRGVATNVRLGQALHAGRRYKLVIDADWPDAHGQPLVTSVEKEFFVTPAVRSTVETESWTLNSPNAGSKGPLKLTFDRPLDHALLDRFLSVCDADGRSVAGRVELGQNEFSWKFYPQRSWKSGSYKVTVQPELEDLAGNNLYAPLDQLVGHNHMDGQNLILPFSVKLQSPLLDAPKSDPKP